MGTGARRTVANRLGGAGWAFVLLMLTGGGSALAATGTSTTALASTSSWTVYHGNPGGTGVAPSVTSVNLSARAWTSRALDGPLYGEPLVSGGRVFVATENDTVYALPATTGAIEWSRHLGSPVPSGSLPCGNITPSVGIIGTPVIDEARGEIFVVADELVHGRPAHQLVGLSTATGAVELNQNVDPTGSTPSALLQRTALTLDAGRVVFGYGGNYGDCSTYHGWVMSVPEGGGTPSEFAVDSGRGESQGAVWMGGAAPVVDAKGNIFVTAGNGSVTSASHAYDHSDSVLELSSSLTLSQYFAPTTWPSDNAHDLDLSTDVALLPGSQVLAGGKSGRVYLLNGSSLGGIGGQRAQLADACGNDIDGGFAVEGSVVYLPCLNGPVAVRAATSPAGLRVLWTSSVGGGPPIVAGGLVWTIGADGVLYGLNPSSGTVQKRATIGAPANHFPTPSVGAGLLLATSADRVVAFSASPPGPAASTTTTAPARSATGRTTTAAPPAPPGSTNPWVIAAAIVGSLAVVGGLTWFLRRQRRGTRNQ